METEKRNELHVVNNYIEAVALANELGLTIETKKQNDDMFYLATSFEIIFASATIDLILAVLRGIKFASDIQIK